MYFRTGCVVRIRRWSVFWRNAADLVIGDNSHTAAHLVSYVDLALYPRVLTTQLEVLALRRKIEISDRLDDFTAESIDDRLQITWIFPTFFY